MEYLEYLKNPDDLNDADRVELEKVIEKYPYFQGAWCILSRSLKDIDETAYKIHLPQTALLHPNRSYLKSYIVDRLSISNAQNVQNNFITPDTVKKETEAKPTVSEEKVTQNQSDTGEIESEPTVNEEQIPQSQNDTGESTQQNPENNDADRTIVSSETSNESAARNDQTVVDTATDIATDDDDFEQDQVDFMTKLKSDLEKIDDRKHELLENAKKAKKAYLKFKEKFVDNPMEQHQTTPTDATQKNTFDASQESIPVQEHTPIKAPIADTEPEKTPVETPPVQEKIEMSSAVNQWKNTTEVNSENTTPQTINQEDVHSSPPPPVEQKQSKTSPSNQQEADTLSSNLISENLVQIYENQGLYKEAIEVLQKLIFKFPEKKDIFAQHINKLEEKL